MDATQQSILRVDRSAGGWEAIPAALINDDRLGLDTRGFAAWLLARPGGWEIRATALPRLLSILLLNEVGLKEKSQIQQPSPGRQLLGCSMSRQSWGGAMRTNCRLFGMGTPSKRSPNFVIDITRHINHQKGKLHAALGDRQPCRERTFAVIEARRSEGAICKIKGRGTIAASSRCLHMGFCSTSKIATVLPRFASC
jgi:hypothetical protein